ncbi:cytoplasmic protein [Dissulfurirhabdus thermomarina]|uniref:Cytoplasmic protein n=1 Tax=Dissulfurirhabdus thermomarina TaxID=1765737 RepID=A0A6N9TMG9_DISTH|nr:cytoplasmic protein [Dissulfurirhabdus thermomarina]NDY42472.1 cytoplasmic protein [Dissulfurirhabdus thermomarina]NMX23367.1 cytoplasmic protein [Dissulfurirhabdus thermomarina]
MLKKDLILRNPLRLMGRETGHVLSEGGFGAVVARAGVGKTALLVQLALDHLLRGEDVLHVSLDQPVKKVCLWYDEVFRHIRDQYELPQAEELWESILPHRFIMTFNVDGFSVPKLEERVTDLTAQGLFEPQVLLVDGLPFDEAVREPLSEMKIFVREQGLRAWFSARAHRSAKPGEAALAAPLADVADFFEVILQLTPKGPEVEVQAAKMPEGAAAEGGIVLDPNTLLIKNKKG